MIKRSDIEYSAISLRDPVGNVFFADNRVFRIISPEYKELALAFLQSETYRVLLHKDWIVRTWIANDVESYGESLVLEHEKLSFISSALWSFSQWQDAATLTLKVRDLCVEMGGDLRDCRPNNIAFKNGRPVMIDYGSFLYKEHVNKQSWNHLFYCTFYRALYHMSYREPFMAHAWGEYASYYFIDGQIQPTQFIENTASFRKIYGRRIKYYDVWIRQKYKHFCIYTFIGKWLLQLINIVAGRALHKEKVWQLFKMQAVFKKPRVEYIKNFKKPYYTSLNIARYEESREMVSELCTSILPEFPMLDKIMLYGTFNVDDIMELRQQYKGKIVLASNNDIYIDKMYNAIKELGLDVVVAFYDIFMEQDERINNVMQVDLICVQGGKNIWEPIYGPVKKFYGLSNYVYTNNETHYEAFSQTNLFKLKSKMLNGRLYIRN